MNNIFFGDIIKVDPMKKGEEKNEGERLYCEFKFSSDIFNKN